MFFTLIAIALLSLLMISVTIYSVANERENVNKRVESMNKYVFSLEEDLSRKLFISEFRILFLFEKRITENGQYISDVNATFNEAFFEGTIGGYVDEDEEILIQGILFSDIIDDVNEGASKINVKVNLSNPVLTVSQVDPWNVRITLVVDMLVEDIGKLAKWNRTATFNADVPINHFSDPIYIINTGGLISPKVNQTPYASFDNSNISNLTNHINNFYYFANPDAPNFLNRLEGNLSANPNGVESLVNIQELFDNGISVFDKDVVDHIYFNSSANPPTNLVPGMPTWFKLDDDHYVLYNS